MGERDRYRRFIGRSAAAEGREKGEGITRELLHRRSCEKISPDWDFDRFREACLKNGNMALHPGARRRQADHLSLGEPGQGATSCRGAEGLGGDANGTGMFHWD